MNDRSAIPIALLAAVDPQAAVRPRRLEAAVELVQSGCGQREVSAALRARFGVSTATAWRTAGNVFDLAGSTSTGAARGRISSPLVNGRLTRQRGRPWRADAPAGRRRSIGGASIRWRKHLSVGAPSMTEARSPAQAAEAWARCSRFQSLSMAIDLANPDGGVILGQMRSTDALRVVALARRAGARFFVMAGPLLRKRPECSPSSLARKRALPSALDVAVESISHWASRHPCW